MSFPKYPAYKDSGVEWIGKIPSGWLTTPLRTICTEKTAKNDPEITKYYLSLVANIGVIPYAEKGDVGNKKPEDLSKCKIVSENDFVINSMNFGIGSFGLSKYNGICSPVYIILKVNDQFHINFFRYVFENKTYQTYCQSFGNGILAHRSAISWDILKGIELPFPPLPEQQAIASFLDRKCGKIDALIAQQKRLIALLAEKRQAVISHAVTKGLNPKAPMKDSGIPWIGMVPEGWEMMRVKNILLTIEQGWSPQCENYPRSSDSEWAVLKVGCVNTGIFNPSENKVLPETLDGNEDLQVRVGDLLVSRANTRDLVGRSAVAKRNYSHLMICDKIFRLRTRPDLCFPEYLSFFLQSSSGRHVIELAASGASQSMVNIGQGTILEMIFPVPPLETQRHILKNLNYNEEAEAIKNANQFINLALERRAALISAAVTGKIDVRAQSKALAA
ncbi:hypothetical protein AD947_11010 [Acetobacter tropicalis]|uniref:Type I restriction modification DNA specificity domain-containing protein n=1 Tax=Acetobacter tropicalis TaxID=104102 RepID=A0A149TT79_9PROT|nr:restriction endonuclease subunit S [Acetobacter tropicalis]KXV56317.1 hypothetical protein AD947_11010 [Acetobacter tropicalis]